MGTINAKTKVLLAEKMYLTSPFGMRTLNGRTRMHNGIDLVGWNGKNTTVADIISFDDGKVIAEGFDSELGNFVRVWHDNGIETAYYHLKERSSCKVGLTISKGTVIGKMGSTGNSTGNHLHFGLKRNGEWVDPIPYLSGENNMDYEQWKDYMGRYLEDQKNDASSEWSRDAIEWAMANEILYGDANGKLMPKSGCTREMVIVFLFRFYRLIVRLFNIK